MKLTRIAAIASLILFTSLIALAQHPSDARSKCDMTAAPQTPFTPKGAQPPARGTFFFGTPKLSVLLNHSWSIRQSVRWFSDDAPSARSVLKITGRRLDPDVSFLADPNLRESTPKFVEGPALTAQGMGLLSTVAFPTAGCWEITARMNDTELRFVTYIDGGALAQTRTVP
jgi:hypothetical protein